MSERFRFYNYTISTDPHLLDEISHITPELHSMMETLHKKVQKGGEKNIRYVKKLIEQYPRVPQLKNYLSVAYMNSGMEEKGYEINDWVLEEHPDYLFGILNKAYEYYLKGEHEKMPQLLGENMELSELYPDRDVFHFTELMAYLKTTIHYFIGEKDWEEAQSRLELMKELDPTHPEITDAVNSLAYAVLDAGIKWNPEEEKTTIQPYFKSYDKSVQTNRPPEFHNPIINRLYESDFEIDRDVLTEILRLPRETAIRDLQKVLYDSICRYEYFNRQFEKGRIDEASLFFPIHAVFLLGEMEAGEALDDILETFRQGEEFVDFWYGDILLEVFWLPLYKLTRDNFDTFERFMLEPGIYTYAKSVISQAFFQCYLHHPEKRDGIVGWYEKILKAYNSADTDNLTDAALIGFIVCDVLEADFHELMPVINQLYDAGYVEEEIPGTKKEVERDFGKKNPNTWKNPILSIYEQYDEIVNNWYKWDEGAEEETFEEIRNWMGNDLTETEAENSPVRKQPKIGRNEPCPCGSGKKYKKCCGKNT